MNSPINTRGYICALGFACKYIHLQYVLYRCNLTDAKKGVW